MGLGVVQLLSLISLGLGPGWRLGHADFRVDEGLGLSLLVSVLCLGGADGTSPAGEN